MNIEDPVIAEGDISLEFISNKGLEEASLGELVSLLGIVQQKLIEKFQDPNTRHNFAEFSKETSAQDWGTSFNAPTDEETTNRTTKEKHAPVAAEPPQAPERDVDSFPRIMKNLGNVRNRAAAIDSLAVSMAEDVVSVKDDWLPVLGIPEGVKGFKDGIEYVRTFWNISGPEVRKMLDRARIYAVPPRVSPGAEPELLLPVVSEAFFNGDISSVNADRIVRTHNDLVTYAQKTDSDASGIPDFFKMAEGNLVTGAVNESPWVFSQNCAETTLRAAHLINPDGPAPDEVLKKKLKEQVTRRSLGHGWYEIKLFQDRELLRLFRRSFTFPHHVITEITPQMHFKKP